MRLGKVQCEILTHLANGAGSPWRNNWPLGTVRRLIDKGLVATNSGLRLQMGKMVVHITDAGREAIALREKA